MAKLYTCCLLLSLASVHSFLPPLSFSSTKTSFTTKKQTLRAQKSSDEPETVSLDTLATAVGSFGTISHMALAHPILHVPSQALVVGGAVGGYLAVSDVKVFGVPFSGIVRESAEKFREKVNLNIDEVNGGVAKRKEITTRIIPQSEFRETAVSVIEGVVEGLPWAFGIVKVIWDTITATINNTPTPRYLAVQAEKESAAAIDKAEKAAAAKVKAAEAAAAKVKADEEAVLEEIAAEMAAVKRAEADAYGAIKAMDDAQAASRSAKAAANAAPTAAVVAAEEVSVEEVSAEAEEVETVAVVEPEQVDAAEEIPSPVTASTVSEDTLPPPPLSPASLITPPEPAAPSDYLSSIGAPSQPQTTAAAGGEREKEESGKGIK